MDRKQNARYRAKHPSGESVVTISDCSLKQADRYDQATPTVQVRQDDGRQSTEISINNMCDTPPEVIPVESTEDSSSTWYLSDVEDEVQEYLLLKGQTASMAHEGASFYLRLGAMAFGVGNLIYVGVELEYYLGGHIDTSCPGYPFLWPIYFHLIFIFVQSFFLFKNTRIFIQRHKGLVRFGLMHVLATNICVWIRVLVREVMEGILHTNDSHAAEVLEDMNSTDHSTDHNTTTCYDKESLLNMASPYLFPFVLEYSLIAAATMAGLYSQLGIHITKDIINTVKKTLKRSKKQGTLDTKHDRSSAVDFSKSHVGGFLGFVVLAGSVISIAIFFFSLRSQNLHQRAQLIYHISDFSLHVIMLGGVIIASVKLYHMRYDASRCNTIDNILIVVSMCGGFLFELFMIITYSTNIFFKRADYVSIIGLAAASVSIAQSVTQTVFIVDGLHRFCATKDQREQKPGRGILTFLIVTNVAVWIFKTFQIKEVGLGIQEEFYGATAWQIILNVNLPLTVFFRFHSSICLADIWSSAYIHEEDDESCGYMVN